MRNGLWPRVIKNMTQVTRAPGRNGPAFASSNHANSTPAAAAGAIENTTLLHASQPLVAIDKSSNFSSAARMVSACQPMQSCPTYSAASNKPALQFRAQASGMPISTKSDSTAAKRGVAAHKPTAGEFIARAGKLLLLAASMAISVLSLAAPELHEASNALSPLAGYEQQVETHARWRPLGWVGVVGPGPGRQAPSAGPVGRVGCIWPATRSPLSRVVYVRVFIPPGERARRAMAPHRPASPGAPPAPYAPPHNGALGLITSRWRGTRCARRHLAPSPTGTMSAQSMLTMQPTRRCPQAHRPNAHPPVEGAKLAG